MLDDTQTFLNAVRNVVKAPKPGLVFHLPEGNLRDTIHAGLVIWTTEVHPTIESAGCLPTEGAEDCLLLGKLVFTWDSATNKFLNSVELDKQPVEIDKQPVKIHQQEAPVLLDNKVLQEWLAALQANTVKYTDEAKGDVTGKFSDLTVVRIQNTPVVTGSPADGEVLVGLFNTWVHGDHGNIAGLGDDDHPQYLLADGTRPLTGDWDVGNSKKITGLIKPTAPSDAVRLNEAVMDGDPALGDLSGTYPDPTVARLQGNLVAPTAPSDGQALIWSKAKNQWEPTVLPASSVDIDVILNAVGRIPILPLATISLQRSVQLNNNQLILFFRIWFHLEPGLGNTLAMMPPLPNTTPIEIFCENSTASTFLNKLKIPLPVPDLVERNVWNITLTPEVQNTIKANPLLRFVFHLGTLQTTENEGTPLLKMMENHTVHWESFDRKETVTVYLDMKNLINLG